MHTALARALAVVSMGLALSAQAVVLKITPTTQLLEVGDPLSVRIDITGLGNGVALSAFDVQLNFDDTLISFTSAVFGDPNLGDQLDLSNLGINAPLVFVGPGAVTLIETSFDPTALLLSSQAADFSLTVLSFKTLAPGSTSLSIQINSLADAAGEALAASAVNGTLTLASVDTPPPPPPGVPEPWAWLLVITSALLVAFVPCRRRRT